MAEWSDVANNLVLLVTKRPLRFCLLLLFAVILGGMGFFYYTIHRSEQPKKGAVSVQTNGAKNQTAGTNDGTMVQENK